MNSNMHYFHCVLSITVVFIYTLSTSHAAEQKHWALLVAGSNGFFNYRHQADICHAYHIVRNHGIPDEQIVVMMYDDIANNEDNPIKGNIINQPNGTNLYPGVLKDYTGEDVKPEVFLKVLTGDEEGVEKLLGRKGKVIKSGFNDTVFVNFVDHGAPGLIGFPDDVLHAKDLNDAILQMYQNKQYKEMVFYLEACESGSMFQRILARDINVFATTAANPDESSYACYFDDTRNTYLGDVYSVNWMHDSSIENLARESLQKQFKIVKQKTTRSHVREYGDFHMKGHKVGAFQGNKSDKVLFYKSENIPDPNADAVPSEDVRLEILKHKMRAAAYNDKQKHAESIKALLYRKFATVKFFKDIVQSVTTVDYKDIHGTAISFTEFTDFTCYINGIKNIRSLCPGLDLIHNDYALRNLRALANLCETAIPKEMIWKAINDISSKTDLCMVV